jgi:hypothetical protein
VEPISIDLGAIFTFAREVGGNALLVIGLFAIVRGWLVPKSFVDEIRKDRDEWKQLARGSTQTAAEGTRVQSRATSVAEEATRIAAEAVRAQLLAQQAQAAAGGIGMP